jgi:hypothetical protein
MPTENLFQYLFDFRQSFTMREQSDLIFDLHLGSGSIFLALPASFYMCAHTMDNDFYMKGEESLICTIDKQLNETSTTQKMLHVFNKQSGRE